MILSRRHRRRICGASRSAQISLLRFKIAHNCLYPCVRMRILGSHRSAQARVENASEGKVRLSLIALASLHAGRKIELWPRPRRKATCSWKPNNDPKCLGPPLWPPPTTMWSSPIRRTQRSMFWMVTTTSRRRTRLLESLGFGARLSFVAPTFSRPRAGFFEQGTIG